MNFWERYLDRWQKAGLLDADAVTRIRDWERNNGGIGTFAAVAARLAVALGGIAAGAGVLQFVAANWDSIAPLTRLALLLTMLALFHGGGIYWAGRFPALATTLHAIGTVSLGAAIALAAQTFHMDEHWTGGALLWLSGAGLGVWVLRDWPHAAMVSILGPIWLVGQSGQWLGWREEDFWRAMVAPMLSLAMVYLGVSPRTDSNTWRMPLMILGSVGMIGFFLATMAVKPGDYRVTLLSLGVPLAIAFLLDRRDWWVYVAGAAWVLALQSAGFHKAALLWHALGAAGWLGLAAWGVARGAGERVNVGVAGFGVVIISFYFSSVLERLERSLSLIVLGVLLLGTGLLLERLRKRLLASMERTP